MVPLCYSSPSLSPGSRNHLALDKLAAANARIPQIPHKWERNCGAKHRTEQKVQLINWGVAYCTPTGPLPTPHRVAI